MAHEIIMPRVGQSVESCIIVEWKVAEGDVVEEGQVLCEAETDKATFDVESTAAGTVLAIFAPADSDVPVLQNIAAVGEPGENVEALRPAVEEVPPPSESASAEVALQSEATIRHMSNNPALPSTETPSLATAPIANSAAPAPLQTGKHIGISPRAKNLAIAKGIDYTLVGGSGPEGRIIERDVMAVVNGTAPLSVAAKAQMAQGGVLAPLTGSGLGGRVLASDLVSPSVLGGGTPAGDGFINLRVLASDLQAIIPQAPAPVALAPDTAPAPEKQEKAKATILEFQGKYEEIKVRGVRKIVAERMTESLLTTAQLTLNTSADATAIMDYRKTCKAAPEKEGLGGVTINDTVMYAILKTLAEFPELNAYMQAEKIIQFENIHLGFAVDTPIGLMVPVIRDANKLSLKELSTEAKRLGKACQDGSIDPDYLTGGTFTVTNLGAAGIESFTPVLNAPQVGILGVCSIQLKPVMVDEKVKFVPHVGLSLTFDHCAADGAPAAKFLKILTAQIADFRQLI